MLPIVITKWIYYLLGSDCILRRARLALKLTDRVLLQLHLSVLSSARLCKDSQAGRYKVTIVSTKHLLLKAWNLPTSNQEVISWGQPFDPCVLWYLQC